MRWSSFFLPTGRDLPAEATAPSHRLMIRGGLVRQLAAGVYIYLPLGLRALRKVEAIIRQEMGAAGALELLMPAMQPIELWQESGRDRSMGATLIRLPDQPWRRGTVLGPTHEEVITDIARSYIQSYKQLPVTLYQIQTKFRDEQRPRGGVLGSREFLVKDAYSFDRDVEGLATSYDNMYRAYCRIFARCGLAVRPVEAESGPIGGGASHEFMVPTDAGGDVAVLCTGCGYAANLERAEIAPVPGTPAPSPLPELAEVHTPSQRTIDEVCTFLGRRPDQMVKTLIYRTAAGQIVVALVRGDHEVNPSKLARAAGAAGVELADPETIRRVTGAEVGFAGPQGLARRGVTIIADHAVAAIHDAATGANRTDHHVVGLEPGRDFPLDHVADIRNAVAGDRCPRCGAALRFQTCVQVAHVVQVGAKYSEAMKAGYLDERGTHHPFLTGVYEIRLNRIVAAAIEAHHDEKGIVWPISIAPFQVLLLNLEARDDGVTAACDRIYAQLQDLGMDVLYDDRGTRPGPKFVDADLIGIPLRMAVGRRSYAQNQAELKWRDCDEVEMALIEAAAQAAAQRVRSRLADLNRAAETPPA